MRSQKSVCKVYPPVWPLAVLTAAAPGLFYEWESALASLILMAYLLYCRAKIGKLRFPTGQAMIFSLVFEMFLLLSPLWAVDKGMAIFGFIKFLPLPLFVFALGQTEPESRSLIFRLVPYCGAGMTILSFLLGLIPALASFFLVNGRLAGFFQYPNSFAAYLLIGTILIAPKLGTSVPDTMTFAVLLAGIALTGSRSVFVLTAAAIVILFFFVLKGNRRGRLFLIVCSAMLAAAVMIYAAVTGDLSSIGRIFTASLESSTFLGRLLYYKDALPVIGKHPLGLGYLGYSFAQGSFQTGVYSVMNIHNELLQLLLDVGWVPAALAVWAVCAAFVGAKNDALRRTALVMLCLHCLFDFDLQFISLDFLFLSLLEIDGKKQPKPEKLHFFPAACTVLAALCLWLGTDSFLLRTGHYAGAVALYGGCTSARIELLSLAETPEEMDRAADEIIARNRFVSIAYSAKARAAFSRGDTESMIENKRRAIELAKYSQDEYDDFRFMLGYCIDLYESAGSEENAEYCRGMLAETDRMIDEVLASTSKIAWKLTDKPDLK